MYRELRYYCLLFINITKDYCEQTFHEHSQLEKNCFGQKRSLSSLIFLSLAIVLIPLLGGRAPACS